MVGAAAGGRVVGTVGGAAPSVAVDVEPSIVSSSGDAPAPERLARQGAALLASMLDASRALGLGSPQPEAAISTAHHHLILKPVPRHPGVALHVVLQAHGSNLTLARLQIDRIDVPD